MSRHRRLVKLLTAAALALAAVALLRGGDQAADSGLRGTVIRVIDGDTIAVRLGDGPTPANRAGRVERVRYIGVDTPESVKRGTPVECFADAARALNDRLVGGRHVRLVTDVEQRDRYDRLLAYVYREGDDLFVNAELLRRGYAQTLTIAPNVRHADRFGALARQARAAGNGLWRAC